MLGAESYEISRVTKTRKDKLQPLFVRLVHLIKKSNDVVVVLPMCQVIYF